MTIIIKAVIIISNEHHTIKIYQSFFDNPFMLFTDNRIHHIWICKPWADINKLTYHFTIHYEHWKVNEYLVIAEWNKEIINFWDIPVKSPPKAVGAGTKHPVMKVFNPCIYGYVIQGLRCCCFFYNFNCVFLW